MLMTHSVTGAEGADESTDPAVFRRMLGHFCSGVVIVTADDGGTPVGMTCQSFSSLSLSPPLVMFAPAHTSTTWPRIRRSGLFAVNILGEDQAELCRGFARTGVDKFADVAWTPGVTGTPLIVGAVAHIECRLESVVTGGDHDIVLGSPLAMAEFPDRAPLLFFRSTFGTFADAAT